MERPKSQTRFENAEKSPNQKESWQAKQLRESRPVQHGQLPAGI